MSSGFVTSVAMKRPLAADLGQRRDGLVALALPASGHHDQRAAAAEGQRSGAPDPGRAAGDEDDLVLEVLHPAPRHGIMRARSTMARWSRPAGRLP